MRRTLLIALLGPLALLASLGVLAVTMGPQYVPAGWHATADKWRPEIERVNVQTQVPIDTTAVFADVRFEPASNFLALTATAPKDNQCLHPDWIYAPQGFGGHTYWMVMTPFPTVDATIYEAPEIFYSDNGTSWTAIAGNPIDPYIAGTTRADPSLLLDKGILYCFFMRGTGGVSNVVCRTSTDGLTWSGNYTVIAATTTIWAPVVRNVKGTYYMWCVDATAGGNDGVLKRRSASAPLGPYSDPTTCTLTGTGSDDPWHVNVQQFGDKYLLIGTFKPSLDLYLGVSTDGLTFACQDIYSTPNTRNSWDDAGSYQAALVQRGDGSYDVMYGGWDNSLYYIGIGRLTVLPHPRYNKTPLVRSLEILGTECVGFWPLLESSGTAIVDLTGLHNITASEDYGRFDTAPVQRMPIHVLKFNATDEHGDIADHVDFSLITGGNDIACSMGAWVKIASAVSCNVMTKFDSTGGAAGVKREWKFDLSSGKPLWIAYDDSVAAAYEGRLASAALSVNVWHHVVFTRDATQGESASDGFLIYVDGALDASSVANDDAAAGTYVDMEDLTSPVRLGSSVSNAGTEAGWFNGSMAMPFVTRKQLTAWEVRCLYEYQKLLMGL